MEHAEDGEFTNLVQRKNAHLRVLMAGMAGSFLIILQAMQITVSPEDNIEIAILASIISFGALLTYVIAHELGIYRYFFRNISLLRIYL